MRCQNDPTSCCPCQDACRFASAFDMQPTIEGKCPEVAAKCGVGKYRFGLSKKAAGDCFPCAQGQFNDVERCENHTCKKCAKGKYGDGAIVQSGSNYCQDCPIGRFMDATGQHYNGITPYSTSAPCKQCPSGKYQASVGSSECAACSGTCASGLYESSSCSPGADRVCSPKPVLGGITGVSVYAEGSKPIISAPAATVQFATAAISKATITLAGSPSGVLSFNNTAKISHTFARDASSAVATLTLSGAASAAEYEAALRSVRFHTPNEMPGHKALHASLTAVVCHTDQVCSKTHTMQIKVLPVNDVPVVTLTGRVTFYQDGNAVPIAAACVVTDVDHTKLKSATVQLGAAQPGDELQISASHPISSNYEVETGSLQLSGEASVAQYQAALRTVTFVNSAPQPSTVERTVAVQVVDIGGAKSASSPTVAISVCAAAGNFADTLMNRAQACPSGKHQPRTCQVACVSCTEGKFGNDAVDVTSPKHCAACPLGQFQPLLAQTSCLGCAKGRYGVASVSQASAAHCVACVGGTAQNATAQTSCDDCAAGHFSKDGQATCKPWTCCKAGTYKFGNDNDDDGSCFVCPQGKFKTGCSLGACSSCAKGRFGHSAYTVSDPTHCQQCAAGEYQDQVGQDNTGSSGCKQCAPGRHSSGSGWTTCSTCQLGRYQASSGESSCTMCAAGRFGSTQFARNASTHCRPCPHGTYSEVPGAQTCLKCPVGRHAHAPTPTDSKAHCVACSAGRYQDEVVFAYTCKDCPTGKFQPIETAATECAACGAPCGAGKYESGACTAPADRVCSPIPAIGGVSGCAVFIENQAAVNPAPVATVAFGANIVQATVRIVGGTIRDVLDFASTTAVTGTFSSASSTLTLTGSASAAVYEQALRAVRFHTVGDMHMVHEARKVTLDVEVCHSASVCSAKREMCVTVQPTNDRPILQVSGALTYVQGTLTPLAVATNAVVTDKDHTHLQNATARIAGAQAGDRLGVTATSGITGSFDAATHTLALTGRATLAQYQVAIRTVTFATAAPTLSTRERTIAFSLHDGSKASLSSPSVSVSVCAAKGYFADAAGYVVACPTGKYQSQTCQTECASCSAGTFGSTAHAPSSASHCQACAAGRYQTAPAQTSCVACAAGRFGPAGNAVRDSETYCQVCQPGTFAAAGQVSCTACAAGTFAASSGKASCDDCACGQFQSKTGQTKCTECAIGTSNPLTGQASASACAVCGAGGFTARPGQCDCNPWKCCAPGEFNQGASTTTPGFCQGCPVGKYRGEKTCSADPCLSWGAPCGAGMHKVGASASSKGKCEACLPGTFKTPEHGDWDKCTNCHAGRYGWTAGAKSMADGCLMCKRGQYSVAGATTCTACAAGKYGDMGYHQGTKEHCRDCAATTWTTWTACSKTCDSGLRTRTRVLEPPSSSNSDAIEQCPVVQKERCNTRSCPGRHHCHYLKCRFNYHAASEKFAIQVYHHHKEPHNVHHCKLYTLADGTKKCHCYCWYLGPTGKMLNP